LLTEFGQDGRPVVTGDQDGISQGSGTIQYQPGGEVTVSVTVNKNKREANLSVTDTGSGIGAEDLPRIFERFYRGDPARTQGKGFGLGLSLAKEIVEAHKGRITVDSQPGKGSRFTIVLCL